MTNMNFNRAQQWMKVAEAISLMSTCPRRKVGALILAANGHILSTGFNGMPTGMTSCIIEACPGATESSRAGLEKCMAIHAEQNAMIQLGSPREACVIVCTSSPCIHCTKMLLNTPIKLLIYRTMYDQECLTLWRDAGRESMYV